jgi:hypothetical protein
MSTGERSSGAQENKRPEIMRENRKKQMGETAGKFAPILQRVSSSKSVIAD